jgi:predicted PurR-regulated permease PerM
MAHLSEARKWNKKLAAGLLVFAAFLAVAGLAFVIFKMLDSKFLAALRNSQGLFESVQAAILGLEKRFDLQLLTPGWAQNLSEWVLSEASGLLNATLSGLLMVVMTLFILWFLLAEGRPGHLFFHWLPLKNENSENVRRELNGLVFSNALGIPLMGLVQGTVGLAGYLLAGVGDPWFWAVLTGIAGMLPIFGVMLAYVPLALVLFSKGLDGTAAFVLGYGFVVIGSVDNLARMWLLKKIGHTHPLITLFGVLLGLKLFGFVGFIFGPIMIALLFLLVKIYLKEFK